MILNSNNVKTCVQDEIIFKSLLCLMKLIFELINLISSYHFSKSLLFDFDFMFLVVTPLIYVFLN